MEVRDRLVAMTAIQPLLDISFLSMSLITANNIHELGLHIDQNKINMQSIYFLLSLQKQNFSQIIGNYNKITFIVTIIAKY